MATKIYLVTPSLTSGGAERVISELAIYFSAKEQFEVTVVCLIKEDRFYKLPANVTIVEPDFDYKNYSRLIFTYKIYKYLRTYLQQNPPDVQLSFGGKYNSFVLLAAMGLKIKTFVSDRSRPTISYGKLIDRLNAVMYRRAAGIVAQTEKAKSEAEKKTGHNNIRVIGNPIKMVKQNKVQKENLILNAGRFIRSKNQHLLIEYFARVNDGTWKLVFLGNGEYLEQAKAKAKELDVEEYVIFAGVVQDVESYYNKAKIFAFTSTSEGFPNVLGEALSTPLACISYDCVAGPSDLIEDGKNGFLVKEMDHEDYIKKLKMLMDDAALRTTFEREAERRIQYFKIEEIGSRYLDFLTGAAT